MASCKKSKTPKVETLTSFPFNTKIEGEFLDVRRFSSGDQYFFVLRINVEKISDKESVSKAPFSPVSEEAKIERMTRSMAEHFDDFLFSVSNTSCFEGLDSSGFWLKIVMVDNEVFIIANPI